MRFTARHPIGRSCVKSELVFPSFRMKIYWRIRPQFGFGGGFGGGEIEKRGVVRLSRNRDQRLRRRLSCLLLRRGLSPRQV